MEKPRTIGDLIRQQMSVSLIENSVRKSFKTVAANANALEVSLEEGTVLVAEGDKRLPYLEGQLTRCQKEAAKYGLLCSPAEMEADDALATLRGTLWTLSVLR